MRVFIGIAAVALVAGCQQAPKDVTVDSAWVRLPAVTGNPGAAYFTIHGGSKDAVLVDVSAKFARVTEMHQSMMGPEGLHTMAPLDQVTIAAGKTGYFQPGGHHVMLYDISPTLKPGEKAPITLSFADGKKIEVQAIVIGAGDPDPK